MIQRFQIPYAESATNAAINPTASLQATAVANRLCGRRLNFNTQIDSSITICSKFISIIHVLNLNNVNMNRNTYYKIWNL